MDNKTLTWKCEIYLSYKIQTLRSLSLNSLPWQVQVHIHIKNINLTKQHRFSLKAIFQFIKFHFLLRVQLTLSTFYRGFYESFSLFLLLYHKIWTLNDKYNEKEKKKKLCWSFEVLLRRKTEYFHDKYFEEDMAFPYVNLFFLFEKLREMNVNINPNIRISYFK
jgi:hypothetical protein